MSKTRSLTMKFLNNLVSQLLLFMAAANAFIVPTKKSFFQSAATRKKRNDNHRLVGVAAESSSSSSSTSTTTTTATNFDWTEEWYPILPIQDLSTTTPNKVTLLGKDFVVWFHSTSNSWRAFADSCPHRLVPLSEGRLDNDQIQCAYHGWEFNEVGDCTRIPQLAETATTNKALTSPRACATVFPVRVEQDLLWLFPNTNTTLAQTKSPALIPELDDPTMIDGTNFFVRDMPYSWDILVENLCDPAHVPFAHHSFMRGADRTNEDSLSINVQITNETTNGFTAERIPPGMGQYDVQFTAPALLYYRISNSVALSGGEGGKKPSTASKGNFIGLGQYCVPTAPGQCRLIARFPLRIPIPAVMWIMKRTPRWITHFSQNIVMDSDVIFLCSQDEYLDNNLSSSKESQQQQQQDSSRNKAPYYMPAQCDSMVVAFRKWLSSSGGGQPEWLGLPASRSNGEPLGWIRPQHIPAKDGRDALLDRFRQHTEICSSCRRAHKVLYGIRQALRYSGILFLAITAAVRGSIKLRIGFALASILSLLTPPLFLQPLIARMECVPWPRKKWLSGAK